MSQPNITFIGGGNMTAALVVGLVAADFPAANITVSNPSIEKLQALKDRFDINITQDNVEAASGADIIVFAVKPNITPVVCKELKAVISENNPLLVSVVTGVSIKKMEEWVGGEPAIVRTMPNTPAAVLAGATGLFPNAYTSAEQKEQVEMLFRSAGIAVWLDSEDQIDLVIALSGSGPAYYFLFMEAMQEAGVKMGLTPEAAELLTSQTALGAARMVMESGSNVVQLRESVTSPKGTTEAAIHVFESGQLRETTAKAMQAAFDRAKVLAAELEKES